MKQRDKIRIKELGLTLFSTGKYSSRKEAEKDAILKIKKQDELFKKKKEEEPPDVYDSNSDSSATF